MLHNKGFLVALILFSVLYTFYHIQHPQGFSSAVLTQNANEMIAMAFVAMAQTVPVLIGGLDLSVGAVMTLTNTIASELLNGTPLQIIFGAIVTVGCGAAFGFFNGIIIVYGRIQPIIATLATGAIAMGIALIIRPRPGGNVDADLSWAVTNTIYDFAETYQFADGGNAWWLKPIAGVPVPFVFLFLAILLIWVPFKKTVIGRTLYAVGSAEGSAYVSGLPVDRAKITAFTLAGLFSGCAGLYLTIQISSGNADITQAGAYTLNSIAAVVLGGTSLLGGVGGAIGSVIGAMILRVISFYFRILSIDPLLQPLIRGIVLLGAVSVGTFYMLRIKNKLELFR